MPGSDEIGSEKTYSMITIVTSTLNADATIGELVSSLRAQCSHNFEWIIADGASVDRTLDILNEAGDVVTQLLRGPDFGIYDGLNRAISLVKTPYYLVLGADDVLDPDAIRMLTKAAEKSGADFISGHVRMSRPQNSAATLRHPLTALLTSFLWGSPLVHCLKQC